MTIRTRIYTQCLPENQNSTLKQEEIFKVFNLPFVPHRGMYLKVSKHSEFMVVSSVSMDVSTKDGDLVVCLDEPSHQPGLPTFTEMATEGWSKLPKKIAKPIKSH